MRKLYNRLFVMLFISVASGGCSDEQAASGAFGSERTPEWTLQQYQTLVDQNRFEEAKQFSTPAEQARLTRLAAVMVGESLDDAALTTNFLQIKCREERRAVYCRCLVEDEYERYEMMFKLVRSQGQWLVDAPDGRGVGEEEVIDGVLDGMREIIQ